MQNTPRALAVSKALKVLSFFDSVSVSKARLGPLRAPFPERSTPRRFPLASQPVGREAASGAPRAPASLKRAILGRAQIAGPDASGAPRAPASLKPLHILLEVAAAEGGIRGAPRPGLVEASSISAKSDERRAASGAPRAPASLKPILIGLSSHQIPRRIRGAPRPGLVEARESLASFAPALCRQASGAPRAPASLKRIRGCRRWRWSWVSGAPRAPASLKRESPAAAHLRGAASHPGRPAPRPR